MGSYDGISILSSHQRREIGKKLRKDYSLVKPSTHSNQVYNYVRWGHRNSSSCRLCARRFYGDISHESFRKLCKVNSAGQLRQALGSRLDMSLCRLEFFTSNYSSRQAILHAKKKVNNKKKLLVISY